MQVVKKLSLDGLDRWTRIGKGWGETTLRLQMLLAVGALGVLSGVVPGQAATAPPTNDALVNAISINETPNLVTGTTIGATLEAGEPLHVGSPTGGSVWYRWDAFRWPVAAGATNTIQVTSSAFTPRLAIYRLDGNELVYSNLTKIVSKSSTTKDVGVKFGVEPGATYLIAVAASKASVGAFNMSSKLALPKTLNIDLAVVPKSVKVNLLTRGFSDSDCDVSLACTSVGTRRVLSIGFDVANRGTQDLVLGDPSQSPYATNIPCSDNLYFEGLHRYTLRDAKNKVVKISETPQHCLRDDRRENPKASANKLYTCSQIQGLQAGWIYSESPELRCAFVDVTDIAPGTYTLEILMDPHNWVAETVKTNNSVLIPVVLDPECSGPPSNDNRANAIVLSGEVAGAQGNSECATFEKDEAFHALGSGGGRSIWYEWTAPYTGPLTVATDGSNFDTVLDVQEAADQGVNGPSLATNDNASGDVTTSEVHVDVEEGKTYWIAIDGYTVSAGQGGRVLLSLNPGANDTFTNAQILKGLSGVANGGNLRCSRETGEPKLAGNAGGHSVWFHWTAPTDGVVTLNSEGSFFKTLLGVFQGTNVAKLTAVASTTTVSAAGKTNLKFTAVAGRTYSFVLDGKDGATGIYSLSWNQAGVFTVPFKLTATRDTLGNVAVSVTGKAGQLVDLQRSSNLNQWQTLTSLAIPTSGKAQYLDALSLHAGPVFYRVQVP